MMARVIFFGTPEFAVSSLQALTGHSDFTVVGVVTQPDRPAGRGQSVRQSAVKVEAVRLGLPVFQPETLRVAEAINQLREWSPDVLVVAAFGQILKKVVLKLAPYGSINVHASLLPRWRGAAPIQAAIRAGDAESGVTIMKMDEGLDTGPMLKKASIPISSDETAATLHDKLALLGADILPGVLLDYIAGEIAPQPQPVTGATYAPTLEKDEGQIEWTQTAEEIDRHVRAFTPWPGTYTFIDGKRLKIISGYPQPGKIVKGGAGTIMMVGAELGIQTGEGVYFIKELQLAGKKRMDAEAFLIGRPDVIGIVLQ